MAEMYRAVLVGCGRMGAFIDNEVAHLPWLVLPYSHAAGYEACGRVMLVAGSDLRPEVLDTFGQRYGVPAAGRYLDYREMIEREKPDIVSVATQPEDRADVIAFAVERGVRAIYCEKPLAASLEEADRIGEIVTGAGAFLNMGTNRRWHPGFDVVREMIESETLGKLRAIAIYDNGTLFNTSSHTFDLASRLSGDAAPAWVCGHLPEAEGLFDGTRIRRDPLAEGMIAYTNGVRAHAMLAGRSGEYEAICEGGTVQCLNNGRDWVVRRKDGPVLVEEPFPEYPRKSSTLCLIEDLVHSLDTGEAPRGGVGVAVQNTELLFGFISSHLQGSARVAFPVAREGLRLERNSSPHRIKTEPGL